MMKTLCHIQLEKMFFYGADVLQKHRVEIDDLNVFPVPDGDTGTNMSLTITAGVEALKKADSKTMLDICTAMRNGVLRGARGNSGVILSQIIRGICMIIETHDSITIEHFVQAMENATQLAYSTVYEPKEGTILTVMRMMSEFARNNYQKYNSFNEFFAAIVEEGEKALVKTKELLPVLQQAGVVDSGGKGLLYLWKGFLKAIQKKDTSIEDLHFSSAIDNAMHYGVQDNAEIIHLEVGEIQFAYCVEFFIINIKKEVVQLDIDKLKDKLKDIGDSLLCIGDVNLIKIHVHTNQPDTVLSMALEIGEIDNIKIENMLEQNRQYRARRKTVQKKQGLLSICLGEGFQIIFNDLLVDFVLEGGQTKNPSTQAIVEAAEQIHAENIYIFPNDKNIHLACQQAKALLQNKNLIIIPTKNVVEGIAAALAFDSHCSVEDNTNNMINAMQKVVASHITSAIRDIQMNDLQIQNGDIIGLHNEKIIVKACTLESAVCKLIALLKKERHEIITLYYGMDIQREEAEKVSNILMEKYPNCEILCLEGGQPIYNYILSIE